MQIESIFTTHVEMNFSICVCVCIQACGRIVEYSFQLWMHNILMFGYLSYKFYFQKGETEGKLTYNVCCKILPHGNSTIQLVSWRICAVSL